METVSVYADDDLVEEFDEKVWELKTEGKIDRDASRSEVIRDLMQEWVEGKSNTRQKPSMATVN